MTFAFITLCLVASLVCGGAAFVLRRRLAEARDALARSEAMVASRGRSLGLLARDIETPGLSLLSLAARTGPPTGPAIEAAGRRLLSLADEISDQLALSAGPRRLDPVRLPLGPLLRETVEEVGLPFGPAGRNWRLAPEAEAAVLHADARAMKRVLSQALARAVRETRAGDWIVVRLHRAEETVSLIVEDEGAGLPPGDLAAPSEGTRGVGFGLATARDLMRAHGGDLTLETAAGIGARTWITLPKARLLEPDPVAPG